jgi:hypothetical protein
MIKFCRWAPIYIYARKSDEADTSGTLYQTAKAGTSIPSNALPLSPILSKDGPKQKGFLNFELTLYDVNSKLTIHPETDNEEENRKSVAERALYELKRLKSVSEALQTEVIDEAKKTKLNEEANYIPRSIILKDNRKLLYI